MGMVLSKMGINRNATTEICSGPSIYARLEVPELWPIQGASKNKLMISHLCKTDMVGANLQVELNCLQLQAGISWNILSCDGSQVCNSVDHCWATNLWEFNDEYGLMIHLNNKPWLLPQQQHDQFLMEAFLPLQVSTKKWLKAAQCCQLYLGVNTLAGITNSAGTHLAE